jgi:uncharacterized protein
MRWPLAVMSDPIERCDVWELARRGRVVEGELAVRDAERLAEQLADDRGALHFRFSGLIDERGRAAARLDVGGAVQARCDRCGGPVEMVIREHSQFYFVDDERELGQLPIDDSPEEPLLGSHRFDLAALVEDQAILAMPISPRHGECTAADADGTGARPDGKTRRPFEVLAFLKKPKV